MKRMLYVIVLLTMALVFSGCGKNFFTKETPIQPVQEEQKQDKDTFIIKVDNDRTMRIILQEILANGELVDKDIYVKRFGEYEYTWERWVIREGTGDFHVAIIENGILINISPANDIEDARRRFEPYGGWRDKK